MNWITTNIRFPEDMYMDLKMEAAKRRKSVAQIVRERLAKKEKSNKKVGIKAEMHKLEELAKRLSQHTKGLNLTRAVIKTRYEQ